MAQGGFSFRRPLGQECPYLDIELDLSFPLLVQIAVNPDFTILDETDEYIVVDKPAPLQVHPSKPSDCRTLWHGLRDLLAYELANGGQISIINRLDRETSGVVLVAKNRTAARLFGIAMQERRIHKTYLAVVHGWPSWEEYDLEAPILRQGEVMETRIWVKQCVHRDGTPCQTRFRVLRRVNHPDIGPISLVEASPITGRMHQIRVHLAHLQHSIVGDKIYGRDENAYLEFIEKGWSDALKRTQFTPTHALHSNVLSHATIRKNWAADLPETLRDLLRSV